MSAGCALGHLPDGRLPAASKHAARKAAPEEKYAKAFSPMGSQDVCSRPAAQTSGVKNPVSTGFFTLLSG